MSHARLLALALVAVFAAPAWAQDTPPTPANSAPVPTQSSASTRRGAIRLGVNAGIGLPFGDYSNQASAGFGFGLTGDYMLQPDVAIGGEVGTFTFGGNHDLENLRSAQLGAPAKITNHVVPLTVHAKYFLPASVQMAPFVKAGAGLYHLSQKLEAGTIIRKNSTTRLGLQFGAGADFHSTSTLRYGVDILYHYIATSGSASSMLTLRGQLMFGLSGR